MLREEDRRERALPLELCLRETLEETSPIYSDGKLTSDRLGSVMEGWNSLGRGTKGSFEMMEMSPVSNCGGGIYFDKYSLYS